MHQEPVGKETARLHVNRAAEHLRGEPPEGLDNEKEPAAMAQQAIVGEKVGMTQVWDDENRVVPVTVLRVSPCRVVQVKTPATDGYSAIQVTRGVKSADKLTRSKGVSPAASPARKSSTVGCSSASRPSQSSR